MSTYRHCRYHGRCRRPARLENSLQRREASLTVTRVVFICRTNSVATTLWSVNDTANSQLMEALLPFSETGLRQVGYFALRSSWSRSRNTTDSMPTPALLAAVTPIGNMRPVYQPLWVKLDGRRRHIASLRGLLFHGCAAEEVETNSKAEKAGGSPGQLVRIRRSNPAGSFKSTCAAPGILPCCCVFNIEPSGPAWHCTSGNIDLRTESLASECACCYPVDGNWISLRQSPHSPAEAYIGGDRYVLREEIGALTMAGRSLGRPPGYHRRCSGRRRLVRRQLRFRLTACQAYIKRRSNR